MEECEEFGVSLAETAIVAEMLPTTTVDGEVLGIKRSAKYLCCCACNKKINPAEAKVVTCGNCGLKQKVSTCISHWCVHVLFKHESSTICLTLFDEMLQQILGLRGSKSELKSILEEKLVDEILSLPTVRVTFNKKTKVVSEVEKVEQDTAV